MTISLRWPRRGRRHRGKGAKILVIAPLYPPAFLGGGPIRTLHAMISQARKSDDIYVLTSAHDLGQPDKLPVLSDEWSRGPKGYLYYASTRTISGYVKALFAARRAAPDVVYCNSLFDPRFSIVPAILDRARFWGRTLLVIAPRGELSAGALGLSPRKKSTFLVIARLLRLYRNTIWHASTDLEAREIRATIDQRARVHIQENETLLPSEPLAAQDSDDTPKAVFLSRISKKKGLHVLLEALQGLNESLILDIYGAAEDPEYFRHCRNLASKVPMSVNVNFRGPVNPEDSRYIFNSYDAFLFPTRGENFGHVVAEALSASCPVFVSDQTPWTRRIRAGGGVVVADNSPSHWLQELRNFSQLPAAQRTKAKERAAVQYRRWAECRQSGTMIDWLEQQRLTEQ